MDTGSAGEITRLLHAHHQGDREAFDRMVPLVYERMRRIARGQLAGGRAGRTLDTSALVHETYLQLVKETGIDWNDRSHFFGICARAMRRILVDYLRQRGAQKRGGADVHVEYDDSLVGLGDRAETILAIDQALDGLASFNERLARVVECRSFAGMTEEETAQALGISLRTVQRDWLRARAWLRSELGSTPAEPVE